MKTSSLKCIVSFLIICLLLMNGASAPVFCQENNAPMGIESEVDPAGEIEADYDTTIEDEEYMEAEDISDQEDVYNENHNIDPAEEK